MELHKLRRVVAEKFRNSSATPRWLFGLSLAGLAFAALVSCASKPGSAHSHSHFGTQPGAVLPRQGDEIVVAGQLFHTGTRVVLWMDPNGYDAYRVERRFAPFEESSWEKSSAANKYLETPNRYGLRKGPLSPDQIESFRGGGWDLESLQGVVDQFVLHFDACGTSRQCFKVLHDLRCLSVHFMVDLDGTIYQTLDLKERAWHATTSNTRSIGIEIANIGAYSAQGDSVGPLDEWYQRDAQGNTTIQIPEALQPSGILNKNVALQPARNEVVTGAIQGKELKQYDLTQAQYDALIQLTATLHRVFPKIQLDYPRDKQGALITHKLPDEELNQFQGVLGHYHIQDNKVDPGPAFQWDYLISEAAKLD